MELTQILPRLMNRPGQVNTFHGIVTEVAIDHHMQVHFQVIRRHSKVGHLLRLVPVIPSHVTLTPTLHLQAIVPVDNIVIGLLNEVTRIITRLPKITITPFRMREKHVHMWKNSPRI